jgi:hypothetical protein
VPHNPWFPSLAAFGRRPKVREDRSGLEAGRRAIALNHNYYLARFALGVAQMYGGAPEDAIPPCRFSSSIGIR